MTALSAPATVSPPATRWLAFAALALGQLLVEIDDAVLTIALPTIAKDLHLAPGRLPWVINAYVLCFGGFLLLGGVLADRFGARRMLQTGLGIFVVSSTVGVLATGLGGLVAARTGQGIAASLLAPAAMSMVLQTFREPAARTRALSLWGAVTGTGVVLGLIAGGAVTEWFGWRWLFGANAIAAMGVGLVVRTVVSRVAADAPKKRRIEPVGAVAATVGLFALVYTFDAVHRLGWADPQTLVALVLAISGLSLCVTVQRRHPEPLIPRALLRERRIVVADLAGLLAGAGLLGTFFFVSLYLQTTLHYSPLRTGAAYLPLIGALMVAAGLAPTLMTRLGHRIVMAAGFALCSLGLLAIAVRSFGVGIPGLAALTGRTDSYATGLLPAMVLTGLGLGAAFITLTNQAVPDGESTESGGTASALLNTALQLGGGLGLAIFASLATSRTDHLLDAGEAPVRALTSGYGLGMVTGAVVVLLGALVALALPRTSNAEPSAGPE
jgi:MFS family permease